MELKVFMKNIEEPIIFSGDRIDVLEYERQGILYQQIRCFKKGFSKSEYIEKEGIKRIEKN
ncbi:hypothetical protein [Clostridium grantii]|uniref:Uncharacterized protein n=1 Tax=Clostridium grantii DSM 8605 TaxID=1121316 RepID=A0A1M5X4P5_9CLOT|nr:hypothetical protein [Clostridium grantii]SHH94203.1 hypothetical protein SAMN02745207_03296 [Clostridium grantii DSM 8605]